MINVAFDYNEYKFSSVKECDIKILYKWIKQNNSEDNVIMIDEQILYRRFLEYYITEDEFFIKVVKNDKISGIIKGSINKSNKMELFLWFFVVGKENRNKGEGKKIIEIFLNYMSKNYLLINVKVGVSEANKKALNFWNCLGFEKYRTSKNFFQVSDTDFENLIVMNKKVI